jgi:hypothetical protein
VTDFLKASLLRQITVLGARKPSDCTRVEDCFYTMETLTHLYNNRGMSSLDNEFARRVSVTTKDIELVLSQFSVQFSVDCVEDFILIGECYNWLCVTATAIL